MQQFVKLPLKMGNMMEGEELATCDPGNSIAQHIQMLLTTRKGENRYDPEYGCGIWDLDFELVTSEGLWKERFRHFITETIQQYEKRIMKIQVDVNLSAVERIRNTKRIPEIKNRALIYVTARLVETDEIFTFSTELFLGPLSID